MLQVLRLDAQMQKLAEELKHENSLLVFGRGYNYATALEAALKVRFCQACYTTRKHQQALSVSGHIGALGQPHEVFLSLFVFCEVSLQLVRTSEFW